MKRDKYLIRVGIFSFALCFFLFTIKDYDCRNIFNVFLPATIISFAIVWGTDNYFWRWGMVKKFFGNLPNLNGTWDVVAHRDGDKKSHRIRATISQKWSSISIEFDGDRVRSRTTLAALKCHNEQWTIDYIWEGVFKTEYSPRGELHGAGIIKINKESTELFGIYWTHANENSTIGTIEFFKMR